PFAELRSEIEFQMKQRHMALTTFERNFIQYACQKEGEFKLNDVVPLRDVAAMDTPIYLLRGNQDKIIPPAESDRLFEAARGPVVIERIADAGHLNILRRAGDGFMKRAVEWVDAFVPE